MPTYFDLPFISSRISISDPTMSVIGIRAIGSVANSIQSFNFLFNSIVTNLKSRVSIIYSTRASNSGIEFRNSVIDFETRFRNWKLENSGILEAKIGHFWLNFGHILLHKCDFWTNFDWNHFRLLKDFYFFLFYQYWKVFQYFRFLLQIKLLV